MGSQRLKRNTKKQKQFVMNKCCAAAEPRSSIKAKQHPGPCRSTGPVGPSAPIDRITGRAPPFGVYRLGGRHGVVRVCSGSGRSCLAWDANGLGPALPTPLSEATFWAVAAPKVPLDKGGGTIGPHALAGRVRCFKPLPRSRPVANTLGHNRPHLPGLVVVSGPQFLCPQNPDASVAPLSSLGLGQEARSTWPPRWRRRRRRLMAHTSHSARPAAVADADAPDRFQGSQKGL